MKRKLGLFILVLALLAAAAVPAAAIELTWDQACMQKTSRAVQLYVQLPGEEVLTPAQTLAAGTYIRTTGQSVGGKTGISYSANNCDPLYGYIDGDAITSASETVTLPSGKTVRVGEALVRSRQALNHWLDIEYGETLDGGTYTDENGNVHELGNEAAGGLEAEFSGDAIYYKSMNNAFIKNGGYTPTVYRDENGVETPVDVVYMGLSRSMVTINGEKQLVETWRLSWETKAPEDKVLAVVHSPKNSADVKFHAGKSTKSMNLNKVLTNRVLRVISTGKNWTLVDIDDPSMPRGYIATSYLEFYPKLPLAYRSAKLSVFGKTRGSDPVWIRAEDNANGRRIIQFDLGQPLTVYCQNDRWSEVDVGGFHAFILSEFVTLDEITAEAP